MTDAVLRDPNCRPDDWLTFRSTAKTGEARHEVEVSTGVTILRPASKHNPDRLIISPMGRPDLIASVSTRSLKPLKP